MFKPFLVITLSSSVLLSGCLPLVVGGVAAASYMGTQERGVQSAVADVNTKTRIKDHLTSKNYKYLTAVEVSVLRGNVLLTGVVDSPKASAEAENVTRTVKGVKGVYNELFTDGIYPTTQYSKDAWLATQLKAYLFTEKGVSSNNYQVQVVNGHAYILGLASEQGEVEAVRHVARTTKGIVQVHSYVRLYADLEPLESEDTREEGKSFSMPNIDSEDYITD